MQRLTDQNIYMKVSTPLDGAERKFYVEALNGQESVFGLFHFHLELKSVDPMVDFSQILGKSITITIQQMSGEKRFINGLVARFVQAKNDGGLSVYHADIRPWLWQLNLTSNCKIYQNLSTLEIIKDVFNTLGFTDFADRTQGSYSPRDYCVQYQESSLHFITRLMEEEGILYFFEHSDGKHTLVLADDLSVHQICPGGDKIQMRHAEQETDYVVDEILYEEKLIANAYSATDYNFETPSVNLYTNVNAKDSGKLSLYQYPGGYLTTGVGESIANKRIEMVETPKKIVQGKSFCRCFIPGFKFQLAKHHRADLNIEYTIKSLNIRATQERYVNFFEGFPADIPYRPPLTLKKPQVFGTQTAVVVGKSGEEIWPDKYGRVKVQFHWDRDGQSDENSSCWIRVAQVWAGKNWGSQFIPRIGTEVIVSFLHGDPDQPIIIGTVYNATQTLPYGLPDKKNISTIQSISTKSGTAGNELMFDDTKDAEKLYIHAQKDMEVEVENDRTTKVLNDETVTITKNRKVTIKENDDKLIVDGGNRTVAVNGGNETHTNKINFTHDVGANYSLSVKGNLNIDVTGMVTIKGAMIKLN